MPMPNKHMIIANGLYYKAVTKTQLSDALPLINNASFKLEAKKNTQITAIMGPNGAGKSLLLRIIAGLLKPSAGSISWYSKPKISTHDVAIVFQKPILLRRSVRANLEHALRALKTPKAEIKQRAQELLELAHLTPLANRPARVLSGGEQQRLALIRALAGNPKILLLDEATASLDPQATLMIENLIKNASAKGIKVIMVTHDLRQIERLAKDVLFMHTGAIYEHTLASTFISKPKSIEAQAYISGKLILE